MIYHNNLIEIDQVRFVETVASKHITESNHYSKNTITPTCNDVLNGRGKSINTWQGNVYYRDLVKYHKLEYVMGTPEEQKNIAQGILSNIRGLNPSGRFLGMDKDTGAWCDIGDEKAIFEIRQALREGAPELRKQITPNDIGLPSQDEVGERECKQFLEMVS